LGAQFFYGIYFVVKNPIAGLMKIPCVRAHASVNETGRGSDKGNLLPGGLIHKRRRDFFLSRKDNSVGGLDPERRGSTGDGIQSIPIEREQKVREGKKYIFTQHKKKNGAKYLMKYNNYY
jgi:hypothetical protein